MAVPHGTRFEIPFDVMFPQGAYLMGDIQPLTEYQSQEDKARNRPVRPRIDEQTGRRLYRATIADPVRREGAGQVDRCRDRGRRAARATRGGRQSAVPARRAGGPHGSAAR